jgi:hypothetical protein
MINIVRSTRSVHLWQALNFTKGMVSDIRFPNPDPLGLDREGLMGWVCLCLSVRLSVIPLLQP